jgi:hypothetical protein
MGGKSRMDGARARACLLQKFRIPFYTVYIFKKKITGIYKCLVCPHSFMELSC